jgi:hypothetical protein
MATVRGDRTPQERARAARRLTSFRTALGEQRRLGRLTVRT